MGALETNAAGADETSVGRYRVLGRLAKGGMAEVLLGALDGAAGVSRAVVIKRVLPHLAEESQFRTMFLDEAKLVAGLRHPNVVSVLELGEDDGLLFLVMEYLQGEGLDDLSARVLHHGTSLEPRLAAFIIAEACAGLHAAHTHTDPSGQPLNIIHRDVSPHNIFLGYDGHVKLIDFGIAQSTIQDAKTQTGVVKGKISYMAPEQLDRRELDHRVDVFALGIVLWELLTGRRLFKRESPMETVRAVCFDPIPGPLDVRDDVPVYLDGICRCALSRLPEHRYESAAAMRADLLKCIRSLDQTGNEREELSRLLKKEFAQNQKSKRAMIRSIESGGDAEVSTKGSTPSLTPASMSGPRIPPTGTSGSRAVSPSSASNPPPAPETVVPRPHWRQKALVFAGVTLATLVLAFTFATRGDTPLLIKSAAEESGAPTVVLHLMSVPPGASVEVDGEGQGVTPLELTLEEGSDPRTLSLTLEGHLPASRTFVPDGTLHMEVALLPEPETPEPPSEMRQPTSMRPTSMRVVGTRDPEPTPRTTETLSAGNRMTTADTSMRIFRVD